MGWEGERKFIANRRHSRIINVILKLTFILAISVVLNYVVPKGTTGVIWFGVDRQVFAKTVPRSLRILVKHCSNAFNFTHIFGHFLEINEPNSMKFCSSS